MPFGWGVRELLWVGRGVDWGSEDMVWQKYVHVFRNKVVGDKIRNNIGIGGVEDDSNAWVHIVWQIKKNADTVRNGDSILTLKGS